MVERRCAPEIYPFLSAEDAELLRSEIRFQAGHRHDDLPRGVIHADLFRDNVLFHDGPHGTKPASAASSTSTSPASTC